MQSGNEAKCIHSPMFSMVKISCEVEPSISFTGSSCHKQRQTSAKQKQESSSPPSLSHYSPISPLPSLYPTCFFAEPPNKLIPEEEEVEERELRLACLSQTDSCMLTVLKLSSTSLSRARPWEQRAWRKERAARTRSSSQPGCVNHLILSELRKMRERKRVGEKRGEKGGKERGGEKKGERRGKGGEEGETERKGITVQS